jgi:pilus assembly protein CpaB
MRSVVNKPVAPTQVPVTVNATEVLVARRDLALGELTKDTDFRWQTWPADAITPAFITNSDPKAMEEVAGSIVRSPVLQGEPITRQKVIKAGHGGVLAAILPSGMRAISTRIKEETAAGRLILPNDRVDVILTRRERNMHGNEEYVSDTLFYNVRVLAIGQEIGAKDGTKTQGGNTATLELTAAQSEQLARANSQGEISLALRSIADGDPHGKGPTAGLQDQRGSVVRVLKYGVPSRAYGVN